MPMSTNTAEQMSERLFMQSVVVMEAASVWLGRQLGWYDAIHRTGPVLPDQLAGMTSTTPRYAREWLEQQAVAGILVRDDDGRFALPEGHAEALLDDDSTSFAEPLVRMVLEATNQLPALAQAYRDGGGVSWEAFGEGMSQSQGDANRPLLLHALARDWIPQIPDLHDRLLAGGRVADVACGHGWSAIGLARAYPGIEVHGFDMDSYAIAHARRNAADHGVAGRVHFHEGEISGSLDGGPFVAALAVECIHDMAHPVEVLSALRASCADDAVVVIIDEAADSELVTPGDEVQRLLYGFSLLICLPDSMSHPESVATGTVIRPATMNGYAKQAGFAGAVPLEVRDTAFWRCYRLGM